MAKGKNGGQGFFFKGNKIGILLIHGLTGTPGEMKALGEGIHKKGYTVKGLLLAGHGEGLSELQKTSWRDWLTSVEKGLNDLKKHCSRIYMVGLSVGGALGLYMAAFQGVNGVVTLNAPIFLQDKRYYWAPLTKYIFKYKNKDHEGILDRTEYKAFALQQIPTKTLVDYLELISLVKKTLQEIYVPTLIIQSHFDKVVQSQSADYIFNNLASPDKSLEYFSKSGHLITLGPERELLLDRIIQFIQRLET